MRKNTTRILEELNLSNEFKQFYKKNENYMIKENLSQLLEKFLEKKKLKKSDVIKSAELSEVYGYQIFSGIRVPERKKLLCIILAMKLNIEEAQLLLKSSGYPPLYVKIPFDSVILYGICKKISVIEVNELLYENKLEMLG